MHSRNTLAAAHTDHIERLDRIDKEKARNACRHTQVSVHRRGKGPE